MRHSEYVKALPRKKFEHAVGLCKKEAHKLKTHNANQGKRRKVVPVIGF
jgi:hypothetical protein